MRCCICGEDMAGQPVMQDQMAGVVYCAKDYSYFDSLHYGSAFSSCQNCGFKYSKAYSKFARGNDPKCPNCGAELK